MAVLGLYSQGSTTASISGQVLNPNGAPIQGATIKAVYQPTGSKYGVKTNSKGRFNLVGLKVGGPYSLTITSVGFDDYKQEDFKLEIGQDLNLNIKMNEKGYESKGVTVLAQKSAIMNSNKTGSAQYVSQEDINSLPTYERSIHDYARLSPAIISSTSDGSSVGGRNSKYNNIQIDGAIMNDAFGLSASGTPGGGADAQPISLDAIQEFQVAVSPFDVRQGGFTGGSINAITRSGTNNLKGSVYYFGRNESLISDKPTAYPDFSEFQLGGRVGGPVLKDKLFYFGSAEYRDRNEPQTIRIVSDSTDKRGSVMYADIKQFNAIRDTVRNRYGYDPGSTSRYTKEIGDLKLFMRLDYNIDDNNRLTLRHNFVNASSDRGVDRFMNTFTYDGQEYVLKSVQNQTVLQLNSILSATMANEFRFSFTSVRDKRDYSSSAFPSITIGNMGLDKKSTATFGVERSSQANTLDQDIFEIVDNFSWFVDDHAITLGTSNQITNFDNLFIQDYMGTWNFSSYDDFIKGKASRLQYSFSIDPNNPQPSAKFTMGQFGFYLQDQWSILPNLKVNYGVRGDYFTFFDKPLENKKFASEFAGMNTNKLPSPFALSPRMGFNWDVMDDKELQIRGGLGVFSGNTPGVWFSNQFVNSGMLLNSVDIRTGIPTFDPNNWQSLRDSLKSIKKSAIAITDKDFEMPKLFRTNIGVDYHLGYGIIGTIEWMYSRTLSDVLYKNIILPYLKDDNGKIVRSIDGRPLYDMNTPVSSNYSSVIEMTNTNNGYQNMITVQLQKPFNQGFAKEFSFNLAYTYMDAKDQNSATSSIALSNWQYNPADDPNNPKTVTSNFQIDSRILANISYNYSWTESIKTTIGLYYEGRSGSPFSMLYSTNTKNTYWDKTEKIKDANNDNIWGNDLAYIPEKLSAANNWSDDKMILVNGKDIYDAKTGKTYGDMFEDFIGQFDEAKRGKVSERNQYRQPWRHNLDLRLAQTVGTFGSQKIEVTLDLMNVLNLMNSDWGVVKYIPYNTYNLLEFVGYEKANDPSSRIKASFIPNKGGNAKNDIWSLNDYLSRWRMQIGIRYSF
jgi:hypothetical protein